jgi:hypothetical protein
MVDTEHRRVERSPVDVGHTLPDKLAGKNTGIRLCARSMERSECPPFLLIDGRQAAWGTAPTSYGDLANVAREVAWSRTLFQRFGWPILDVTDQAVEETAARVGQMLALCLPPTDRATISGDLLED